MKNIEKYELFIEKNCHQCRHFVYYKMITAERPGCPIEKLLASISVTGDYAKLPPEVNTQTLDCQKFERETDFF